jgi:hypothetical protein
MLMVEKKILLSKRSLLNLTFYYDLSSMLNCDLKI